MARQPAKRSSPAAARKAQLRTSPATLGGAPAAPKGKALAGRILLARRRLGATGWCGEAHLWGPELLEDRVYSFGHGGLQTLVLPNHMLASWPRS